MDKKVHRKKNPTIRSILGTFIDSYKTLYRQLIKGVFFDHDEILIELYYGNRHSEFISVRQYARNSEVAQHKKRRLLWVSTLFNLPVWFVWMAALFTYIGGMVVDSSSIIVRMFAGSFLILVTLLVSYYPLKLLAAHRFINNIRRATGE